MLDTRDKISNDGMLRISTRNCKIDETFVVITISCLHDMEKNATRVSDAKYKKSRPWQLLAQHSLVDQPQCWR